MVFPAGVAQIRDFYGKGHLQFIPPIELYLAFLHVKQIRQIRRFFLCGFGQAVRVRLVLLFVFLLPLPPQLLLQRLLLPLRQILFSQPLLEKICLQGSAFAFSWLNYHSCHFLHDLDSFGKEFVAGELPIFHELLDFLVAETQHYVFWFEISVYNSTGPMQKIQSCEHLPTYFLAEVQRNTFVVVALDDFEQVTPQYFEYHAEVIAIVGLMDKGVQQPDHVGRISTPRPATVLDSCLYLLQYFHFIESCLHIMGRTLLDFNSDIGVILEVFAEPNCREVPPSQFLDDDVPVQQSFADVDWMIAPNDVIFDSLVLRIMAFIKLAQKLLQLEAVDMVSRLGFLILPLLQGIFVGGLLCVFEVRSEHV